MELCAGLELIGVMGLILLSMHNWPKMQPSWVDWWVSCSFFRHNWSTFDLYFESKQISNHNWFSNNHHFTDQLIVCTVSKLGHVPGFTSHRLSQGLRSVPFVSAGCELLVVSPLSCLVMDWWVCLVSGIILQWDRGSLGDFHGTNNFNSGTYLGLFENGGKPPTYVLLNFHCHYINGNNWGLYTTFMRTHISSVSAGMMIPQCRGFHVWPAISREKQRDRNG